MEKRARPESQRGILAAMVLLVPLLLAACSTVEPGDYDGLPDSGPRPTYFTIVVRPGDTLAAIGARYDVPTNSIVRMNALGRQDDVRVGEVLRIPAVSRRTREAVLHDATTGPFRSTHATVTTQTLPPPPPPPVRSARTTQFLSWPPSHHTGCTRIPTRRRDPRRLRRRRSYKPLQPPISHSKCPRLMATDISSGR